MIFELLQTSDQGDLVKCKADTIGGISDGYHTFDELYEHRCILFLNLMQLEWAKGVNKPWYSYLHHDGSGFEGWFIAGLKTDEGQITYHLPNRYLPLVKKTHADYLENAPEWDGHTSQDVLKRLESLLE